MYLIFTKLRPGSSIKSKKPYELAKNDEKATVIIGTPGGGINITPAARLGPYNDETGELIT